MKNDEVDLQFAQVSEWEACMSCTMPNWMRHSIFTALVCVPYPTDNVVSGCTATTYNANAPISRDCSVLVPESCRAPHQIPLLDHDEPSSFGPMCIHAAQEHYRAVGS